MTSESFESSLGVASMLIDAWDPGAPGIAAVMSTALPQAPLLVVDLKADADAMNPFFLDSRIAMLSRRIAAAEDEAGEHVAQPAVLLLLHIDCAVAGLQARLQDVLRTGLYQRVSCSSHVSGARELALSLAPVPHGFTVVATRLPLPLLAHKMRLDAASGAVSSSNAQAAAVSLAREQALRAVAEAHASAERHDATDGRRPAYDAGDEMRWGPPLARGRQAGAGRGRQLAAGADGGLDGSRAAAEGESRTPRPQRRGADGACEGRTDAASVARLFALGAALSSGAEGESRTAVGSAQGGAVTCRDGEAGAAAWSWGGISSASLYAGTVSPALGPSTLGGGDKAVVPLRVATGAGLTGSLSGAPADAIAAAARARVSGAWAATTTTGGPAGPGRAAPGGATQSRNSASTPASTGSRRGIGSRRSRKRAAANTTAAARTAPLGSACISSGRESGIAAREAGAAAAQQRSAFVAGALEQAECAARDEAAARQAVKGVSWGLLDAFDASLALRLSESEPAWLAFVYDAVADDADRTQALVEAAAEEAEGAPRSADEEGEEEENAQTALRLLQVGHQEVSSLRAVVSMVQLSGPVSRYARELATATRSHALLSRGASSDAEATMVSMAKCRALLEARDFVTPDDVAKAAMICLSHRMQLRSREELRFLGVDSSVLDDGWLTGVPSEAYHSTADTASAGGGSAEAEDSEAVVPPGEQQVLERVSSAKSVLRTQIIAVLAQPTGIPVPPTIRHRP